MAAVDALQSYEEINLVTELMLRHYPKYYSDIWRLGVNLALRVTDLINLTKDKAQESLRTGYLRLKEGKTDKYRLIELNGIAREIMKKYLDLGTEDDIYLFQSRGNRAKKLQQPINRRSIWRVFNEVGEMANGKIINGTTINLNMGTHTMRKTRGCILFYIEDVPLEEISKMLNHNDTRTTMVYLGITQEKINKTYRFEM